VTTATTIGMAEFVGEVRRRSQTPIDVADMARFLGATRIDAAALDAVVRFAPGRYTRHLVHKDKDVEILVLCWASGSAAPIHGHEGEYCWARVERGRLAFSNYREVSRAPLRLEPIDAAVDGGPGYVDGQEAVSVHVYCRPYDECDIYDVAQGTVRRVRLSYDSIPPHLAAVAADQLLAPATPR
jgi:hypothetical protein